MKQEDLLPFCRALRAARRANGWTQEHVASELGISRKTYVLMESTRWLPSQRQRAHFVRLLQRMIPTAAEELVRLFGETLDDYVDAKPVVPVQPAPAVPLLEAKYAKLVFDSALLGVAEELDASPRMLRPLVASLLQRLDVVGMPMAQAAGLAKEAGATGKRRGES
jgi:DNA-binding XRE family transcriptional regulator